MRRARHDGTVRRRTETGDTDKPKAGGAEAEGNLE
jgi:hypothetical protein